MLYGLLKKERTVGRAKAANASEKQSLISYRSIALERNPVSGFDKENIIWMCGEECAAIAAEAEISNRSGVRPRLLPNEEQRGPRVILPSKNRIPAQRSEVEVRVRECDWLRRATAIDVDGVLFDAIHNRRGDFRSRSKIV